MDGHWITRAHGDAQPSALVCVEVDSHAEQVPGQPLLRRERLARWAAAAQTTDHHSRAKAREWSGKEASALWEVIDSLSAPKQQTWVITHRAERAWGLLGLWEQLEMGEIYYGNPTDADGERGRDPGAMPALRSGPAGPGRPRHGDSPGSVPGVRGVREPIRGGGSRSVVRADGWRGFVFLGDGLAAICCRRRRSGRTLMILDARNYGIDDVPAGLDCAGRASWMRDVMRRIIALLSDNGLGSLRITAGSQALYSWRRAHMTHGVYHHDDEGIGALERAGYYGGRCEARRLGTIEGPVYHVDYRSQYGSICAVCDLPVCPASRGYGLPPSDVLSALSSVLAEVRVRTDAPAYPYRERAGANTIYPVGSYWTVLPGPELRLAVERGAVASWGRWVQYHMAPALSSFATALLDLLAVARLRGDAPLCAYLKKVINCLPGKLGQSARTWRPLDVVSGAHWWATWHQVMPGGEVVRARALAGTYEWEERGDWARDAVPAMAAWITSEARVRLLRAIERAGWDEVLYYDTDGIICTERGCSELQAERGYNSGSPGTLRLCGVSESAQVYGYKHYGFGDALRRAGTPLDPLAQGAVPGTYYVHEGLAAAAFRGVRPEVIARLTSFTRRAQYRHGRVGDGGRVYPFVVER